MSRNWTFRISRYQTYGYSPSPAALNTDFQMFKTHTFFSPSQCLRTWSTWRCHLASGYPKLLTQTGFLISLHPATESALSLTLSTTSVQESPPHSADQTRNLKDYACIINFLIKNVNFSIILKELKIFTMCPNQVTRDKNLKIKKNLIFLI